MVRLAGIPYDAIIRLSDVNRYRMNDAYGSNNNNKAISYDIYIQYKDGHPLNSNTLSYETPRQTVTGSTTSYEMAGGS